MKKQFIFFTILGILIGFSAKAITAPTPVVVLGDECAEWCLGNEPDCPPMICITPSTLNNACKQAACQTYKNACAQCDVDACNACLDEKERHAAAEHALFIHALDEFAYCFNTWGPAGHMSEYRRCMAAAQTAADQAELAENNLHTSIMAQIASTNQTCRSAALVAYNSTDCCINQQ